MLARATNVKDRVGAWLRRRWAGAKSKARFVGATVRRGIENLRELSLREFIDQTKRDLATLPKFVGAVIRNTGRKLAVWRDD